MSSCVWLLSLKRLKQKESSCHVSKGGLDPFYLLAVNLLFSRKIGLFGGFSVSLKFQIECVTLIMSDSVGLVCWSLV
jgi:hypothetical protein